MPRLIFKQPMHHNFLNHFGNGRRQHNENKLIARYMPSGRPFSDSRPKDVKIFKNVRRERENDALRPDKKCRNADSPPPKQRARHGDGTRIRPKLLYGKQSKNQIPHIQRFIPIRIIPAALKKPPAGCFKYHRVRGVREHRQKNARQRPSQNSQWNQKAVFYHDKRSDKSFHG